MDLVFLLTLLKWIAIAMIVIGVIYLLYLLYRYLAKPRGPAAQSAAMTPPALASEALELELERALAAGHFSRAARLRWRVFLVREKRTPDRTPYEYFKANRATIEATIEAWLTKKYATMFAVGTPSRADFDEIEAKLANLESKTGEP